MVAGDEQATPQFLALLLQPRGYVHGVAEIGDLTVRIPALADNDQAGIQTTTKAGDQAQLAPVPVGLLGDPVLDGEEAVEATPVAASARQAPAHDDLIADKGMQLAIMSGDCRVNVAAEAGQEVLHPHLAHLLRQRGRSGEVPK